MDNTQRDFQIAVQFMGGMSVPKLAQEHSLSIPSINRILETQKVDRSKRQKLGPVEKVVDEAHDKIGKRLYHYRSFTAYEERSVACVSLGWSAKKVAMVEKGHAALTLADLKAIAAYMQQSLSQLLEDI